MPSSLESDEFAAAVDAARRCLAEQLRALCTIGEAVGTGQDISPGIQVLRQGALLAEGASRQPPGAMLRAIRATLDDCVVQATSLAHTLSGQFGLRQAEPVREAVMQIRTNVEILCAGTPSKVAPLQVWALRRVSEMTGTDARPDSELRIAIAGAMTSGKSTFLNALAGIELLPTRHVAMTCVPTRVELVDAAAQRDPVLLFDDKLRYCLSAVYRLLRAAQWDDSASRLVERHIHLADLLSAVHSGANPCVPAVTVGARQITAALTHTNDLLRLAMLARVPAIRSVLETLEPPLVRVPFSGSRRTPVVLVEIPEPGEIGLTEELRQLADREIERAHAAFLVLDFSRLETTASMRSMTLVKDRPWLFAEGSAVIVNRVDQRRAGDRDGYAVRRFVANHVGRADLPVLETSARIALAAAVYLGADGTSRQDAAQDLLGLCYPDAFPGELAKLTPNRIRALAVRQLERSGICQVRGLVEVRAADALREAARAVVRRALVQMDACQPGDASSRQEAAELADALAWSLQAAENPAPLEGRIAP